MKSKPLFFIHVLVFVIFFKCTTSLSVETLKQSRRCWIHCDFRLGDKLSSGIAPRASYWKSAFGTNIYIYILYIYKYHLPFRCRDIFLWAVDHGRSGWKKRLVVMISGRSAPQCRKVRVDRNGIQRKWVKAPSVYFSLQQGKLMQSPTKLQTHF